ncbi:MAG: uracil-DNA glycosylase [Oligoflexia bacterium]|nr:uracil-DNA glycosylase [Oligoflexia bacterium]
MSICEYQIKLEQSWKEVLLDEFKKDYMKSLRQFLVNEIKSKKTIYPQGTEIFSAFNHTPFNLVKVVIMGQDPYHGPEQAHGLSFSVKPQIPIPPSLFNIYKELYSDLGIPPANHGYLISWAQQGVLLLNATLTVQKHKAGSHFGYGWEIFTDKVVEILNQRKEKLVFLLWGTPAQKKCAQVDSKKHLVLKAPHPSPLSAFRGFFGCKHFSQANDYLRKQGIETIDWRL